MGSAIRKGVALFGACGLAASASAYIGSYAGLTMDGMWRLAIVLHVGVFVLALATKRNYAALSGERFSLMELLKGTPHWVLYLFRLLVISSAVHFLLFAAESHLATPDIKNGEYVLGGRIISQPEYYHLKGAELRLFATLWILLYFVLTAYWWFRRSGERLKGDTPPLAGINPPVQ